LREEFDTLHLQNSLQPNGWLITVPVGFFRSNSLDGPSSLTSIPVINLLIILVGMPLAADFGRRRPHFRLVIGPATAWVLVHVLSRCAPVVQCSSSTGSTLAPTMGVAVLRWNSVPNAPAIPAAAP
jgi:hypothetical protein